MTAVHAAGLRRIAVAVVFVDVIVLLFRPRASLLVFGAVNGALYGLAAAAVVLVHRTHRVVNFAAIALGAVPAVSATLLQVVYGLSYWAALVIALVGGAVLGAAVEVVVIRRFQRGSRLLLTIAILAVVQVLALASERIAARIVSDRSVPSRVPTPWQSVAWEDDRGTPILTGDHLAALLVVGLVIAGLVWFLWCTRTGVAVRAAAENIERAHLLGVPVHRLHTAVWAIAGLVAGVTVFFHTPLVGVPLDPTLGPTVTLLVLSAAVVARLDSLAVAVAAGIGIGMLEQASVAHVGSAHLTSLLALALVLTVLLLGRPPDVRAHVLDDGSWVAAAEPPGMRPSLLKVRPVRTLRVAVGAVAVTVALAAPFVVSDGQVSKLTLIPLTAIVGVSLVVLTGWGGQVSLGQFAFAGAGAGIAGGLAANHQTDFFIALAAGVGAGAALAVLVGLPAARVRGIYLAVVTLALAAATEGYLLQRGQPLHRLLLPHGEAPRVERPALYGIVDLANDRTFYFLSVAALLLAVQIARTFRRSRSGRLALAARDNPSAAAAFGVNTAGARLAAFGLSGGIAALGGVLLAYQQGSVDAGSYGVAPSMQVFLATVLGGITSPMGAVLGATLIKAVSYFVEPHLESAALLFEGPLLLLVLIVNPGGIAAAVSRMRDRLLARVPVAGRAAPPSPEPATEVVTAESGAAL